MFSNRIFTCVVIILATLFIGCQTGGQTMKDGTPVGPTGKIKYEVPRGIDLTDIIDGAAVNAPKEEIYGTLTLPDDIAGKVPAVVIMHASGGVFNWREKEMARLLNKNGIAAFIPYSFEARGFSNTRSTQGTGTTFGMRVADAFGALKLLSMHPAIDPNRIGVMGYSSGGFASLLSIDEKVRKNMVSGDLKFAAHVNVYAASILVFKDNQPTDAPMLFLMGEKDDACPQEKVLEIADKIRTAGGDVTIQIYPGAHHSFDSSSSVKSVPMDNDGNCQFEILNDGLLVDSATGERFPERELYASNNVHIKQCKTGSISSGRNDLAAKR